jgi:hypothetical protein
MLTQKREACQAFPSPAPSKRIRAEIIVDGFVASEKPQGRFDIAPSYKSVADYLQEKGFEVHGCENANGTGWSGGDLSGIPYNECQFDVYTDEADPLQAKLSVVLKILTQTLNFRASATMKGGQDGDGETLHSFSPEHCPASEALAFLEKAEAAESVEVRYRCGELRGSFVL